MKKRLSPMLFYFITFLFLEIMLKIFLHHQIFMLSSINLITFVLCTCALFLIINKIFPEKVSKIIFIILLLFSTVWYCAQFVVKDVFSFYIDLAIMNGAGTQVTEGAFLGETIKQIFARSWQILIMFIPFIVSMFCLKKINFKKAKVSKVFLLIMFFIFTCAIYKVSLLIGKNGTYSAYELNYNVNNTALNVEKLGVANTFYLDIKRTILGFEESINVINPKKKPKKPTEVVYDYNNLDVDFDAISSAYSDATIKTMNSYFASEEGTLQNKYTGYFEGKNLIMFMAESFNELAVSEEATPTLYKLIHGGFEFNDFYSPTIFSTIGGEMQELTGLYPSAYGSFKQGTTTYPMGLGKVFKEKGYDTFAYHDHSYTFQGRNLYLKALGFDNFKGCGNGLEKVMNCTWLESDTEMIEKTFDEYANSENPFMVFYATVSGHGSWSYSSNKMSQKYRNQIEIQNLGYPSDVEAYMASQIELDKALELLLQKLEEKGILDDTVIVLTGDHYPYFLTEGGNSENINFFTNKLGKDLNVEINHSNLIIYNSAMEKVEVNKVGSQIDILPTVYNLFKIPYDSRLIIGKDILATNEGLAMFANRSWVTDKGTYYVSNGKFVAKTGAKFDTDENVDELVKEALEGKEDVTDEEILKINEKITSEVEARAQKAYVDMMNQLVSNRINISGYILSKNYYKIAWDYIKVPVKTPIDEDKEEIE